MTSGIAIVPLYGTVVAEVLIAALFYTPDYLRLQSSEKGPLSRDTVHYGYL